MASRGPSGRIVTFYSYKGGTGRTMLLANVAWTLASAGKRVLMVDWDLEAPGLHHYFHPFLRDRQMKDTEGLIDMVVEHALSTGAEPDSKYAIDVNPLDYVVGLDWPSFPAGACLHLMPAGRQDASYSTRVNSFDWRAYYDRLGGGAFFERARAVLKGSYDYILIDSRTGVSDTSGICTVQMPDRLVVCFALSEANIVGGASTASFVKAQWEAQGRKIAGQTIFPVATRLDLGEKDKLNAALAHVRELFAPVLAPLTRAEQEAHFARAQVLYWPYYAFEETLAVFGDRAATTGSILGSTEAIAAMISEGEIVELAPPSERDRVAVLAAYERRGSEILPADKKPVGPPATATISTAKVREARAKRTAPLPWFAAGVAAALVLAGLALVQFASPPVFEFASEKPTAIIGPVGGRSDKLTVRPLLTNALEVRSIALAPSEPIMAAAGDDGVIRLWNIETFKLEKEIPAKALLGIERPTGVHKIAFSTLGDLIYSIGLDNKVEAFDPVSGRPAGALTPELGSNVSVFLSLAVFPRKEEMSRWVAAGGDDGCLRVWQANMPDVPVVSKYAAAAADRLNETCAQPVKTNPESGIQTLEYAPDGRGSYAAGSLDGSIFFFSSEREARSFKGHTGSVWRVAFSPDSERLASAGGDGQLRVWNIADGRLLRTFKQDLPVFALAWSASGQLIVSGGADRLVRLWDIRETRQIGDPFVGHRKDVSAVAFHPNGKWMISAGEDGMLKVWEVAGASREALLTLIAYTDGKHIVFHRDGTFTGSSVDVADRITVSYSAGTLDLPVPDAEKAKLYLAPEEFAKKLRAGL